jgi:hypothetical protein
VINRLRNAQRGGGTTAVGSAQDLSHEELAMAGGDGGLRVDAVSSRQGEDSLRRPTTKMDFALDGEQYQRAETARSAPVSARAAQQKAGERGDALRPRKAQENMTRAPAKEGMKDTGGGLEFGKLFRILLMIGIIVAIVVFLGGQVLQISKSGDR